MDNKEIVVFIISYNRLSYLQQLIAWLEKAGFKNIQIVDNNSTYLPLLEYLEKSQYQVHKMDKNYGHLVVWDCGKFKDIIDNKYYIVSDCDILPIEECPLNVTEYFLKVLENYKKITKVGFALKIDDIPDYYAGKESVIDWEKQFWQKKIADGLFEASIDTTFALYRPEIYPQNKRWWKSIRTDFPYIARHLPWYVDSTKPGEEEIFYQRDLKKESSFWSITDLATLKEYNAELRGELGKVYSTYKWQFLQFIYKIGSFFARGRFGKKIGQKRELLIEGPTDLSALQKSNKALVIELGSIRHAAGWRFLEKWENFFKSLF